MKGWPMPEITASQGTAEWHDARLGRITASLAAACLGFDDYCSRQKAVRLILGYETLDVNRYMQHGLQFQHAAKLEYESKTGRLVQECGFFVHPTLPFIGASPDGLVGDDGLLETKCPQETQHYIRPAYMIQCLIQLACTERHWCDYLSWGCPPQEPFLKRIYRGDKRIPALLCRLERFYRMFILTGLEPPRKKSRRRKQ
jgi:putative phage-type endonuclease